MDVTIRYDPARARRQQIALVGMGIMMLALMIFGAWMIVAVFQQYPGRSESWIGAAFGLFFALLGLAMVITSVEVLVKIGRESAAGIVFWADDRGLHYADKTLTPWSEIERLELVMAAVAPPRTNRLARLDTGHQINRATQSWLDHHVGHGMAIKDGKRWVGVVGKEGPGRKLDVSLAIGPADFADLIEPLCELADAHGVMPDVIVS